MESDWFQVVIDGYHDHLGRAFFQVNPSGVKFDALGTGNSNPDASWDGIWETATSIDSLGWSAEIRIPYSQLRFSRQEVQVWGLQVRRFIQRSQEQDQWSFWKKTDIAGPARFGHLEGLRIPGVPRHLEVVPYVVGRSRHARPDQPGDPFNDGSRQDARIGGDVKALLTSNLTLNLTLNPDFGQVEVGRVQTAGVPDFTREVEPLTNYFVGRTTRDFKNGDVVLGGIATSVLRRLDDPALGDRLNRHAEAVCSDLVVNWDKKTYSFLAAAELSNIDGSPAAILRSQRSSARYYQRPDRKFSNGCFLSGCYDPTATSLQGLAGYARIAKDGGAFNWETSINTRTPGFEVNDIGFLSRADYIWQNANIQYIWTVPTSWYRYAYYAVGGQQQWTYDGDLNDRQAQLAIGGQTLNFYTANLFLIARPRVLDDRALRGGPVVSRPAQKVLSLNVSTDSRKSVVANMSQQYARNEEGGFSSSVSTSARVKPASSVSISFGPSYFLSTGVDQYVTSVDDPTNTAFYGRRYVLSSLTQKTLSLDTRLNVTFTPNATL